MSELWIWDKVYCFKGDVQPRFESMRKVQTEDTLFCYKVSFGCGDWEENYSSSIPTERILLFKVLMYLLIYSNLV